MEKNRMQKLAGISEGNNFKNGKFTLPRYDVWTTSFGDTSAEVSPDGEWYNYNDVKKLEELANQMYDMLSTFDTPATKMLLKKAKSL